jgi:hypothetical protein
MRERSRVRPLRVEPALDLATLEREAAAPSSGAGADRVSAAMRAAASGRARIEIRPARAGNGWVVRALAAMAIACTATPTADLLPASQVAPGEHAGAGTAPRIAQASSSPVAPPAVTAQSGMPADPNDLGDPNLPPVRVIVQGREYPAIHPLERVRLCKEIAQQEQLKRAGLDWKDLYAVVHAETGWVARQGIGRNGRPSFGLAQLEAPTAAALGVEDPNDPRQALRGAARNLKDAAGWASRHGGRVALSVYYNVSTRARQSWDGTLESLPAETQVHIRNVAAGRAIAEQLDRQRHRYDMQQLQVAFRSANSDTSAEAFAARHQESSRHERQRG